ncbi:serine/threonine protein kinase [Streptomyces sp. CA-210063]|uniref:DnaJ C-terminal domain-containing protein n=1 Tax=Streptomyces sp. CA-210063 TaxID=2801029 RepID=UPI00214BE542|nr:DnaJ C-terminal domain-containing protein [Streptomyces sp. CA-210063]UUU36657.1 serine/threonine protein kinase [Streptomyces sp. CA-210063]
MELERFVARLLAKDPDQRPASAGEVWDILKEINDWHFGDAPPIRGPNVATEVLVTRAEATDGAIIPLRFTTHRACPVCATREDPDAARTCTTCQGTGQVIHEQITHKVCLPAGLRDGQKVRVRELGGPGKHGGAPGDLYVTVEIAD